MAFIEKIDPSIVKAILAILLWASLATLGVQLSHLPPFLLTGLALCLGSLPAVLAYRRWSSWRVSVNTWLVGVGGIFGFHFFLFLALRLAPPIAANLINYLWPLLIVVLAPAILPNCPLSRRHLLAACLGLVGAVIAILANHGIDTISGTPPRWQQAWLGYLLAAGSAITWAVYSLLCKRLPYFSSWAIGGFCLVSGLLALTCHALLEPSVRLTQRDWAYLLVLGLGPMGAAFYLWDAALKQGDPRQIGVLSYATPVLSTLCLILSSGGLPNAWVMLAVSLIVLASLLGR
ncbi:DMT family transporter [Parvibium lacunae]|uniref:DMT family transporter n=1 Tax=Parvibium lacunae TaxID=1888893 RepID=A0A368L636_9BURK|nr:DMT family transporter [Parvibium lacunae]RCS58610.1 DMT family transporter [Parvibium lacunae]